MTKIEKRKLTGKELSMATKGLDYKKQEKEWLEYQLDYHKLMLEKGLDMNHKKNIRDFKQKKNEFEGELEMVKNVIGVLQEQIRNGVVVKEKVEKEEK